MAVHNFKLALLFTGHMIDLPDRTHPRFPPALEFRASNAIRKKISSAVAEADNSVVGIASGARGGDILFLEACLDAGIPIRMVLPFAPERFIVSSVRGVPSGDWEARFNRLWYGLTTADREVLTATADANAYDFCNRQMLAIAEVLADRFRLIALWDAKDKDRTPGGTATFVDLVRRAGGEFVQINTSQLRRSMW